MSVANAEELRLKQKKNHDLAIADTPETHELDIYGNTVYPITNESNETRLRI